MIHHYILTRFNLCLWKKGKNGNIPSQKQWLLKRLQLFEDYCLPSVKGQTCLNFQWILLVDRNTPIEFRDRIDSYLKECPQIQLIGVNAENAHMFASIFRKVVVADLKRKGWNIGDLCLTTYLDNDDSIATNFIEDVQERFIKIKFINTRKLFLSYDYGLQTFTELDNLSTCIYYPNNHFLTLAELMSVSDTHYNVSIRTCYGYGSHFLLEKQGLADVIHISDCRHPMWIEVIHEDNVDNDVKMTFDTHIIKDKNLLRNNFSLKIIVSQNHRMAFLFRVLKQVWRRMINKFVF